MNIQRELFPFVREAILSRLVNKTICEDRVFLTTELVGDVTAPESFDENLKKFPCLIVTPVAFKTERVGNKSNRRRCNLEIIILVDEDFNAAQKNNLSIGDFMQLQRSMIADQCLTELEKIKVIEINGEVQGKAELGDISYTPQIEEEINRWIPVIQGKLTIPFEYESNIVTASGKSPWTYNIETKRK